MISLPLLLGATTAAGDFSAVTTDADKDAALSDGEGRAANDALSDAFAALLALMLPLVPPATALPASQANPTNEDNCGGTAIAEIGTLKGGTEQSSTPSADWAAASLAPSFGATEAKLFAELRALLGRAGEQADADAALAGGGVPREEVIAETEVAPEIASEVGSQISSERATDFAREAARSALRAQSEKNGDTEDVSLQSMLRSAKATSSVTAPTGDGSSGLPQPMPQQSPTEAPRVVMVIPAAVRDGATKTGELQLAGATNVAANNDNLAADSGGFEVNAEAKEGASVSDGDEVVAFVSVPLSSNAAQEAERPSAMPLRRSEHVAAAEDSRSKSESPALPIAPRPGIFNLRTEGVSRHVNAAEPAAVRLPAGVWSKVTDEWSLVESLPKSAARSERKLVAEAEAGLPALPLVALGDDEMISVTPFARATVDEGAELGAALKPALREAARVAAELLSRDEPSSPRAVLSADDEPSSLDASGRAATTAQTQPAPQSQPASASATAQGTEIAASPAASPFDRQNDESSSFAGVPANNDSQRPIPDAVQHHSGAIAVNDASGLAHRGTKQTVAHDETKSEAGAVRRPAEFDFAVPRKPAKAAEGSRPTNERQRAVEVEARRDSAIQSTVSDEAAARGAAESGAESVSESLVATPANAIAHAPPTQASQLPHDGAGSPHTARAVVAQTAAQVLSAAEGVARRETRTLRFDLKPENLGRVEIELTRSGEGRVRAHLMAERGETTQALHDGLGQLRESLERAGLTVERLDVSTRSDLSGSTGGTPQRRQHDQPAAHHSPAFFGPEQPEAGGATRAVEDDRIISLRA